MKRGKRVAVRSVDLLDAVPELTDVSDYDRVRVYARVGDCPVGFVEISNRRQPISAYELRHELAESLGIKAYATRLNATERLAQSALLESLSDRLQKGNLTREDGTPLPTLESRVSASIVVATLNRPSELRDCLGLIEKLQSSRKVEVIVVDNDPTSGAAANVAREFPDVILVEEPRRGLVYARNAGILASTGDIIAMTDDDVRVPPGWLENMLAPFTRNDVMAVTGNVLPLELDTAAQRWFESYGGLGRGFERREVNGDWFEKRRMALPTWELGASANAAFRAQIFRDPSIGLMLEALGPGMPSGVGEDTYLFYKILKAGHTLVYEPRAYVWHRHRRDLASLKRQLYGYSKGHVAYHLTTLVRDRDLRVLPYLLLRLPCSHARRLARQILGRTDYPLSLSLLEVRGNLAGPLALWRSWRRVQREGRSTNLG